MHSRLFCKDPKARTNFNKQKVTSVKSPFQRGLQKSLEPKITHHNRQSGFWLDVGSKLKKENPTNPAGRASKSWRRGDTCLCNFFENLRKILTCERETGTTGTFFLWFWQNFTKLFKVLHVYGILSPFLCAQSPVSKFCLRKRINF